MQPNNDERELCLKYQELVNSIWGKGFRYDMRQEHLASKLLALGYTVDSFIADAYLSGVMIGANQPSYHCNTSSLEKKD
jgi:hypothetical protein